MNEFQKQEFINNYEEALDNTPQEVRDFLWSDAYKGIINGIVKTCTLTDDQKKVVSSTMFDLIINMSDEVDAKKRLTDAGIDEDKQLTIFSLSYDYLISLSDEIVKEALVDNAVKDNEDNTPATTQIATPKTPSQSLESIQQRLKTASASIATTRDYSLNKEAISTEEVPPAKPAIDLYKEAIDND